MLRTARLSAGVAVLAAALALGGCSGHVSDHPSGTTTPTGSRSASATNPTPAAHVTPADPGVQVLTTLDDQRGSVAVGDYTAQKRYAFVYLTCNGSGKITITVDPLGTYPLTCDQTGTGSLNQFEVDLGSRFSVAVDGLATQNWAVTVAQSDTDH